MRPLMMLLVAACSYDVETAEPVVDAMEPALVCNDQLVTTVTVSGAGFAPTPADVAAGETRLVLPDLVLTRTATLDGADGGAEVVDLDEDSGDVRWTSEGEMAFDVHPELGVPEGVYDLSVANLDAQVSDGAPGTLAQGLAVVPPPSLSSVSPEILCNEQSDVVVTVTGSGFLVVDGQNPTVTFGDLELTADSVADCFDVGGPLAAQSCTTATVTVPAGSLAEGVHDVVVGNPDPAGCASTEPAQVEVVPPPELFTVEPDLMCTEQDSALTLTGSGFLVLDGALPEVTVGDWTGPADAAIDCTPLSGPAGGESCTQLAVTVPTDATAPGTLDVSVTNPAPADCVSTEVVQLDAVTAPVVTELVPEGICTDAGDTVVQVVGEGFVELLDGTLPSVTIGGVPIDVDDVDAVGCAPLGPSGASVCTGLDVLVPAGTFTTLGSSHPVEVINPAPADCASNTDVALDIIAPPTLDAILPNPICDTLPSFVVSGTGFQPGASVEIDGVAMPYVTWLSDTELQVDVGGGPLAGGLHDVTVINPDGCNATGTAVLEVVSGPALFFVDPPVIYSEITTQLSLYVGGVTGTITDVWLEEVATGTVYPITTFSFDGQNTIHAEVPAFDLALPIGDYNVVVVDDTMCTPVLENGLSVEDTLELALTGVEPGFAWEQTDTPIDVRALDTASLPAGEVNFTDLPRVYLNPTNGTVATTLRSVSFVDETLLNAVIPSGTPPGTYDVIVVNPPPGNEIGLLPGALVVTADAPPYVDSVAPSRVASNTATPATVSGSDFRNPAVDLVCQEPGLAPAAPVAATVNTFTATSIDVTLPSLAFGEGTVCVVRVTNDDGSTYEYSAVSIGSPSGNLFDWSAGLDMNEARRAPAAVAGRATDRARYLYAIGGDDGSVLGASSTVEVSSLDAFGNMRDWRMLPDGLPSPRTQAGVALAGRFVYLVGGNDGVGAVDEVWRAQILDPLATPELAGLGLSFGGGSGLDGGTYIYRISAVFDATDPVNPDGESLPSDPIVVVVPDVPEKIHLDLTWTPVNSTVPPVGYNVYRTPVADSGSGTEELVAFVAGTGYTDVGTATDPSVRPLPNGALGAWHLVALLPGADAADAGREAPCVVLAEDPLDAGTAYLYVAGGQDGNGVLRDTVHYLDISVGDPDQPVGAFQTSANVLADPRWKCGGFLVDDTFNSIAPPGESWVYFGPGNIGGNSSSGDTEAGLVTSGGELTSWTSAGAISPGRSSYASFAANNFLYIVGGYRNTFALGDGFETEISPLPFLSNWNNLGGSTLSVPRNLPGSAIESAVVFVVGGHDDTAPLTSTEYTNF